MFFYVELILFVCRLLVANILFLTYFFAYKYKHFFKVIIIFVLIAWQSLIAVKKITDKFSLPEIPVSNLLSPTKELEDKFLTLEFDNKEILEIQNSEKETKLQELEDSYQQELALSPTHRDLLINLAIINFYQQNPDQAKLYLQQAKYQDPNHPFFTQNQELVKELMD